MYMKTKYFFWGMVSAMMLTMTFTACNGEDEPISEVVENKLLTVDTDTLKMDVKATSSFNITEGGGNYNVFSENPDVATASVDHNTVTVTSLKKGKTGVVISDAQGNYKRVMVQSMYMSMTLDKTELSIGIKLGHKDGRGMVSVIAGNGEYKTEVANKAIAEAEVEDSIIVVTALTEGTTTVMVTDMMGLSQSFTVTVKVTDVAFTAEEKQQIVNSLDRNFVAWDDTYSDSNSPWSGNYDMITDANDNVVTWNYYNYYYMKFHLGTDLSVGIKQNCKVEIKKNWGSPEEAYDNATIEILKNDGTKIWGVVYVVKDNYLHLGYFCMEL